MVYRHISPPVQKVRRQSTKFSLTNCEVIGFDTEGANDYRGFVGASFITESEALYLTSRTDALDYLMEKLKEPTLFIATNLDYDLAMILGRNIELMRYFYASNRLLYATPNNNEYKGQCWDTVRCIGFYSVKTLGSMIGITKLPTPRVLLTEPIDRELWVCDLHDEVECIECYCNQDARISREAFMLFNRQVTSFGAQLKTTIASTSVDLWRKSTPSKLQKGLRKDYDSQVRESYYGGRVEPFVVGEVENLNYYDVNSLYPYVMASFLYPNTDHLYHHSFDHSFDKIIDKHGVANVEVVSPNMHIPLLPCRVNDKLVFPIGTFTGTYAIPELIKAVELGYQITNVNWSLTTYETLQPFAQHINNLYRLRNKYKADDNPAENVIKILMNSLYGKFGQRLTGAIGWLREIEPRDFEQSETDINIIETNHTAMVVDQINNSYQPTYLNVMWAAYITAYARLHLYSLMEQVNFDIIYCDTDSIFTNRELPTSQELGGLKLEGKFPRGIFVAPKFYALIDEDGDYTYTIKGVPTGRQHEYYTGEHITFQIPVSILQGLKSGLQPASWKDITRSYHWEFDKRCLPPLDTNGFTGNVKTSPLELSNGDPLALISDRTLESIVSSLRNR